MSKDDSWGAVGESLLALIAQSQKYQVSVLVLGWWFQTGLGGRARGFDA